VGTLRKVELQQGTPEWLAWRLGVLGASQAAAIIGECKYMTAYELWLEKTGRRQAFEGNDATRRGNEMEAPARAAYEVHRGFIEAPPTCVLHPHIDYIGASLDGLEPNLVILEMKYPSEASHLMAVNGQVPRHYWIQVQHQLMCVPGAPYANYWSYRKEGPALVRVEHDPAFQAKLLTAEIAFWDLVKTDVPPPLTADDAKLVEDSEIKRLVDRIMTIKDSTTKAAKQELDELKVSVIRMGGHNRVRCGKVQVSMSKTASGKDSYRLTIAKEGA